MREHHAVSLADARGLNRIHIVWVASKCTTEQGHNRGRGETAKKDAQSRQKSPDTFHKHTFQWRSPTQKAFIH